MLAPGSGPVRLSANLGFLWADLPLPDAIAAAAAAGFDAVECHAPYANDAYPVERALAETGLPMVSLNTRPGDPAAGDVGLAALTGRETEAREAIDEAVAYAAAIGCANVHVMAGRAVGDAARATYIENLTHAARIAAAVDVGILIEPINQHDQPGYHLSDVETAVAIADLVSSDTKLPGSVRVLFDCYHVQLAQGSVLERFRANIASIGHVQFAAVPARNEPDSGEIRYEWLLPQFYAAGYNGYCGAEYRPTGPLPTIDGEATDELAWMTAVRRNPAPSDA